MFWYLFFQKYDKSESDKYWLNDFKNLVTLSFEIVFNKAPNYFRSNLLENQNLKQCYE